MNNPYTKAGDTPGDSPITPHQAAGSGVAGGDSGDVQHNDGADGFAGEAAFNYDTSTNILTAAGGVATAGQFNTSLPTGTAPLAVASTTVVPNLNADMVDGVHGSTMVVGPASATDNAIARYDGTTGKLIQDSGNSIDDSGDFDVRGTLRRFLNGSVRICSLGDFAGGATTGNWIQLANNISGLPPALRVTAALDTNVGLDVIPIGTGRLTVNSINVPTISSTDTLTNKTIDASQLVDGSVTLAKMANLAQDQFIGRVTASTGVPETATITAAARTVLDDATVDAMVDTLGGASSTGTGGLVRATSPTLTTPTLSGAMTLAENSSIALDPAGSADGKYSGITVAGTAGAVLAFGDLVYLAAVDSRWELADADAASTSGNVMLGMCVLAAAGDGSATTILLHGIIRADAAFPALTISAQVYVSTTAGDIQVAQPTGTDDVIRVVGRALTADEIYFHPSEDYITHT